MFGRRILSAALAIGAAAALAVGSSGVARASDPALDPLSDVLVVEGTATINGDGAVGVTAGTCPDPADLLGGETAHIDAQGGCGSFTFSSNVCAGVSTNTEVGLCTATSQGTFTNIVCGTGSASGSVNIVSPTVENATATINILFVATIGVLTGTSTDTSGDELNEVAPPDVLVGVVQLGPAQGGGPLPDGPPDCTSAFTISSVTVAHDPLP